jgi:hypothetical protein
MFSGIRKHEDFVFLKKESKSEKLEKKKVQENV